ncbi:gliding motility-associated C-terminal domain-containing protein [Fibrella sp. HMF5335]|uniref:Gliding motility-associated C-terminal domain-containing protein n=1 Tax=Fibrella rubiginis TaxID=2817060 RepID=A0A939K3E3_9BACT|nr:gliding motility-associated C-terminal domain-containing protein [Fibrella rubiginis]MBO0935558.1 gliding motility-associated C-terminal domain-containing protein [Fibrella rubiginis]
MVTLLPVGRYPAKRNLCARFGLFWPTLGLWLLVCTGAYAQPCPAATAEVLINETFGTAGHVPSLNGRTAYQIATTPCPEAGQYMLVNNLLGQCFGVWHLLHEDHTPNDANGTMLIVNSSNLAGPFYQQSLAGLCSGTTYEFSVWGINLVKTGTCTNPLVPNLTIRIETETGQVLSRVDIGLMSDTNTPVWRRFSATFTTPNADEPVLVKLINQQGKEGCGNDMAIDDIQLLRCTVCPPAPVFVPEAFSPNNDAANDKLAIFVRGAVTLRTRIYDRWGTLVFNGNTAAEQWDGTYQGKPCATGYYAWELAYEVANSPRTTSTYTRTGRVLLVR